MKLNNVLAVIDGNAHVTIREHYRFSDDMNYLGTAEDIYYQGSVNEIAVDQKGLTCKVCVIKNCEEGFCIEVDMGCKIITQSDRRELWKKFVDRKR